MKVRKIIFVNFGREYGNFRSKNMRNWCSNRYYHQRFLISQFLFFDIYYLLSINWMLSIFDFLSLFFYLVSFNSILQKVSKLGFMYKHKNYSQAARLNGREHICVRYHRLGRGNPGSNQRRGQRIFFSRMQEKISK